MPAPARARPPQQPPAPGPTTLSEAAQLHGARQRPLLLTPCVKACGGRCAAAQDYVQHIRVHVGDSEVAGTQAEHMVLLHAQHTFTAADQSRMRVQLCTHLACAAAGAWSRSAARAAARSLTRRCSTARA